ncbi:MAG: protein kinase [Thermoproteota archaeon]
MESLIGRSLGRYRILAEIGRGGTGVVYRAKRFDDGLEVALKVLFPYLSNDPERLRKFWEEYWIVHSLCHPNIVRVYEFGEDKGYFFIVSEYINGVSLQQRLAEGKALSLKETVKIISQIAKALDAVHSRGIVHRDLKPSNILIERTGRVVLTDFGIASIAYGLGSQACWKGLCGTPEYMAPEQARRDMEVTYKADIYALGIISYQMLTGRVPFKFDNPLAVVYAQAYKAPPPISSLPEGKHVPAAVEAVIMQALQKDPMLRPQKASVFASLLAAAAGMSEQVSITSEPAATTSSLFHGAKLSIFFRPLIGFIIIGLIIASLPFFFFSSSQPSVGTLAYTCQKGGEIDLCVRDSNGSISILNLSDWNWAPAWSPDGRYIAFTSGSGEKASIWKLELESGKVFPLLTDKQVVASSPSWSPDGQAIAFDLKKPSNDYDIYILQFNSARLYPLTIHPARDSDPAWSPDGKRIAFISERDGDPEIYLIDITGQNLIRLTYHPGPDLAPAWSPDGKYIAYECAESVQDDFEICVMELDRGEKRALTNNSLDDRQPAWSPDGNYIAFTRERFDGSAWDIWILELNNDRERLLIQNDYSNTHPSWKP